MAVVLADVAGKGKAAIFIGVNFASTTYYRNPVINSGIQDEIFFEEEDGKEVEDE